MYDPLKKLLKKNSLVLKKEVSGTSPVSWNSRNEDYQGYRRVTTRAPTSVTQDLTLYMSLYLLI